jgi:branched-chain amino acid transport system permease protein
MSYFFGILTMCGIYAILCLSLNLILGYCGMFHLGHGAFFAIGAYTSALVYTHLGLPFFVELIVAALISVIFGLIIGYPCIKLKGDYLSFATFGFAVVTYTVINNWLDVTNGPIGISGIRYPTVLGMDFSNPLFYFLLVLFITSITFIITRRIIKAPYGKTIESIREDEVAATACGRDVNAIRLTVFCVGTFFAGIAGCLYVHYVSIADPTGFTTTISFTIVSMVLIGGIASISGAVAGACIVVIIPEIMRYIGMPTFYAEQLKNIFYSLILVIIILRRPQGLLGKLKF